MDLKTIQLEILKINQEFITYIGVINQESNENIENKLKDLFLSADEKTSFIKGLQDKLICEDVQVKAKINEYIFLLNNLDKEEKKDKFNLEDAKKELEKQKNEELKPYIQAQKRKRVELTHKITAQKKELTFLHKDNDLKLIEEEKNYKLRDVELTRRLKIDLDRLNEANVKQYSEIEKSILDLEDSKLINEAQEKINAIRLIGIKNILEIKNKFAEQNYANTIGFNKFQEKIKLDNAILTEEFKQRIKTIEFEKEENEAEENLKISLLNLNNEIKLLEFERENLLDQCEFQKVKANKINDYNNEVSSIKADDFKSKFENLNTISSEIFSFDKQQLDDVILSDTNLAQSKKNIINHLEDSLRNTLAMFKELFLVIVEEYFNKRKELINNLPVVFSYSKIDTIFESNYDYQDFIKLIKSDLANYLNSLDITFVKFNKLIAAISNDLNNQINLYIQSIKRLWKKFDSLNSNYYLKLHYKLKMNNQAENQGLKRIYQDNNKKANIELINGVNIYNKTLQDINQKTKKIMNDYNIKKKETLIKIEKCKSNHKVRHLKSKQELNLFIKQSKTKISNLRKISSSNLFIFEKGETILYKQLLAQNKIEYKNRLGSIE